MGLLLMLIHFDPLGSRIVEQYRIEVRQPLETGAAADVANHTILVDPVVLQDFYKSPKLAVIWSSCMLVHEAVHVREQTQREDLPNAFTYICLDRLGAPRWMKDHVYRILQGQVSP